MSSPGSPLLDPVPEGVKVCGNLPSRFGWLTLKSTLQLPHVSSSSALSDVFGMCACINLLPHDLAHLVARTATANRGR